MRGLGRASRRRNRRSSPRGRSGSWANTSRISRRVLAAIRQATPRVRRKPAALVCSGLLRLPRRSPRRRDERAERVHFDQDRVLAELTLQAFSDLTHYETDESGNVTLTAAAPEGAMRALQSIKKKIRSYTDDDRVCARVRGRDQAVGQAWHAEARRAPRRPVPDRVEVSGPNGGPIRTEAVKTSC